MPRGEASGISLSNKDASIVLGMVGRDDREHDIAAWFGVNQGRVAEVKAGSHGSMAMAPAHELPPKGPPVRRGDGFVSLSERLWPCCRTRVLTVSPKPSRP